MVLVISYYLPEREKVTPPTKVPTGNRYNSCRDWGRDWLQTVPLVEVERYLAPYDRGYIKGLDQGVLLHKSRHASDPAFPYTYGSMGKMSQKKTRIKKMSSTLLHLRTAVNICSILKLAVLTTSVCTYPSEAISGGIQPKRKGSETLSASPDRNWDYWAIRYAAMQE